MTQNSVLSSVRWLRTCLLMKPPSSLRVTSSPCCLTSLAFTKSFRRMTSTNCQLSALMCRCSATTPLRRHFPNAPLSQSHNQHAANQILPSSPYLTECLSVASYQDELEPILTATDRSLLTGFSLMLPVREASIVLHDAPGLAIT